MELVEIDNVFGRLTMRETFFTDGRDLFDPNGTKVILRGVNKMSVWDDNDPTGDIYFAEIRKTQANSVRIVWAITERPEAQRRPN